MPISVRRKLVRSVPVRVEIKLFSCMHFISPLSLAGVDDSLYDFDGDGIHKVQSNSVIYSVDTEYKLLELTRNIGLELENLVAGISVQVS